MLSDHLLSDKYGSIDASVLAFYIINVEYIEVPTYSNQSTARMIFSLQLLFLKNLK